jgi:hypothetical protein
VFLTKYYSDDQIKKNEMAWARGSVDRRGACGGHVGRSEGKYHFKDLGTDGTIIVQ